MLRSPMVNHAAIFLFLCIVTCGAAQSVSSFWTGSWKVTPDITCQQSSCCCFTSTVDISADNTGELYLRGPVQGSNCIGPTKKDNIDAPSSLTFDEEFFGLDDYNFALANATDLSGLTITAIDESVHAGACSFQLARETTQLLYGNFSNLPPPEKSSLPFWAFPYLGQWVFDSSCVSASAGCCCLLGSATIDIDARGASSFVVSASSTSSGCNLGGGPEADDFPWPTYGSARNSTVSASFLPKQDTYSISLSFDPTSSSYALSFSDQTVSQCSMHATRAAVTLPPVLFGRSTSRVGSYITEASATDTAFAFWVNWTNTFRGGIRVGDREYRPVQIIEYNDASDASLIPLIYDHLTTTDNVTALFSPFSSTLTAAAESYTAGLPFLFVGSSSDSLYGRISNAFGLSPPSAKRAVTCMGAAAGAGAKTIAAIYTFGDAFNTIAAVEALQTAIGHGMQVLSNDSFVSGTTDFSTYIAQWQKTNPDVLVISATSPDPLTIVTAIRQANWWPSQVYFTTASSLNSARVSAAAYETEWMMEHITAPDSWSPDQEGTDPFFGSPAGFAAAFQAATNETAVSTYVSAFAAGYAVTLAIEEAGSLTSESIADALASLQASFWYGDLRFDSTGAPQMDYMCVQILSDEARVVAPTELSIATFVYPAPHNAPSDFYHKHGHHGDSHSKWIWIGIVIAVAVAAIIILAIFVFLRSRRRPLMLSSTSSNDEVRPLGRSV